MGAGMLAPTLTLVIVRFLQSVVCGWLFRKSGKLVPE